MSTVGEGFILQQIHNRAFQSGDRLVEFGDDAFVTSGTSVEVSTNLTTAECCLLTIKDATPVADDGLSTDGTVTSDAITVFRVAGTTSGLTFYWLFIGIRTD